MRRASAALVVVTALAVGGCGGGGDGPPAKLSRQDAAKLAQARERLDDALDTEESIRTSKPEARRLVGRIRAIARTGALEGPANEKFSRRALRDVYDLVPSVVMVDAAGKPRRLDSPALVAFLSRAERDAPGALLRPATREVGVIGDVLDDADAGPRTLVTARGPKAARWLRGVERDVRPVWPALARRLAAVRRDLE